MEPEGSSLHTQELAILSLSFARSIQSVPPISLLKDSF